MFCHILCSDVNLEVKLKTCFVLLFLTVLALLAFIIVSWYQRRKQTDDSGEKFVVEEDADFDIRENVMFYDEEGAGKCVCYV